MIESSTVTDELERALADAITKAAAQGRFEVLPALVAELDARRKARQAPEVVVLDAARRRRDGGA